MSLRPWLFVLLLAAACGSTSHEGNGGESEPPDKDQLPTKPAPLAAELPKGGKLFRTARDASFVDMVEDLKEADVVYVGESRHVEIPRWIAEHLEYYGRLHAIGMAGYERRSQRDLDDYVFGRIGAPELRERTGRDPGTARALLEFAQSKRIPVVALAPDSDIVDAVRSGGLDAVDPARRRSLPAIDTRDYPEHRAHAQAIHDGGAANFERFYLVFCMREAVMAEGIVNWFRTAPDDAQILVLADSRNLRNRFGIPDQAKRRVGKNHQVVIPIVGPDRSKFSQGYADFLWALED